MSEFNHFDSEGNAHMLDVGDKQQTRREASAMAEVHMLPETLQMVETGTHKKGDVLGVARIAGIQAAKKCSELIPLCHPLALSAVSVDFFIDRPAAKVRIQAQCKIDAKTGVEMEALTAVSVAALTIYDMCKAVDKGMTVESIALLEKSGGASGDWRRAN